MALVQMEGPDPAMPEGTEQRQAAETQNGLLEETVALVPTVEPIGQAPVVFVVLGKIGVEQVDGHDGPSDAPNGVLEGPNSYRPAPQDNLDDGLGELELILGGPGIGIRRLCAPGPQPLSQVSLSVDEGDPDEGKAQIGCGAKGVPCENTQTTAIGMDMILQSRLHRKIGDPGRCTGWTAISHGWGWLLRDSTLPSLVDGPSVRGRDADPNR